MAHFEQMTAELDFNKELHLSLLNRVSFRPFALQGKQDTKLLVLLLIVRVGLTFLVLIILSDMCHLFPKAFITNCFKLNVLFSNVFP